MHVLVSGGSGFVGSYLVGLLVARGDRVTIVSRTPNRVRTARAGVRAAAWLPDLSGFDAVVHLSGESIVGRRWTDQVKAELRRSRLESTQRIVEGLKQAERKPSVLVCASAIGIYGERPGEELTEDSSLAPEGDFLGDLCRDWEAEARRAESEAGVRTVNLRTGIVLGADGGALRTMLRPFRLGVGGPLGSGKQMFSWIHQEDLGRMILFALDHPELHGPLNGVGPNPVSMKSFARTLGKVLRRPALLPAPIFALRLALGEVAGMLTADQKVLPKRALEAGFEFEHGELEPALRDLLQRYLIDEQV